MNVLFSHGGKNESQFPHVWVRKTNWIYGKYFNTTCYVKSVKKKNKNTTLYLYIFLKNTCMPRVAASQKGKRK